MKICGVELKGSDAIVALIEVSGDHQITSLPCRSRKIAFGDSCEQRSARNFYDSVCGFIRDREISQIAVKQRAKKGPFAGGPVTFKMECLLQLNPDVETRLFSSSAIAAARRRTNFELPAGLNKYQEEAFHTACCAAARLKK